jgi:hypothetical protein
MLFQQKKKRELICAGCWRITALCGFPVTVKYPTRISNFLMSKIDLKKSYQHCSLFLHFCLHFWLAHCSVKINGALLAQSFTWQWICSRSVLFALRRITFRPAINYEACGAPLARCALSAFAALADKLAAIAELEHGENKTTAAAPAAHQSCVSSFVANLLRLIFHPIYFSRGCSALPDRGGS